MKNLLCIVLAAFMAVFSIGANAGAARDFDAYNAFRDQALGGTKHTVGFSNGGTPVITRGVPGAPANTKAGNMNATHTAGGPENLGGQSDIPTPVGQTLPVNVRQPLDAASLGLALAHFAANFYLPVAIGVAIYDLAKELNIGMSPNSTGTGYVFTQNEFMGDVGYVYDFHTLVGGIPVYWSGAEDACRYTWSYVANVSATNYGVYVSTTQPGGAGSQVICKGEFHAKSNGSLQSTVASGMARQACSGSACPSQQNLGNLSESQLASLIASQSGWPSGSAIDRATADMINGNGGPFADPSPAGLATLSPDTTTSVTGAPYNTVQSDGSTSTNTQTCAWVVPFNLGTAEYRCWVTTSTTTAPKTQTTTTTVVQSNPDGTTSTSTQTATTVTPSTTTTGTSTSPPVTDLCIQHPEIIACQRMGTAPTAETIPTQSVPVSITPITFAAPGGCPAPINYAMLGRSYTLSYQPMCDLMSMLAPLFIALGAAATAWIFMNGFKL
jgi:hypothetical protein